MFVDLSGSELHRRAADWFALLSTAALLIVLTLYAGDPRLTESDLAQAAANSPEWLRDAVRRDLPRRVGRPRRAAVRSKPDRASLATGSEHRRRGRDRLDGRSRARRPRRGHEPLRGRARLRAAALPCRPRRGRDGSARHRDAVPHETRAPRRSPRHRGHHAGGGGRARGARGRCPGWRARRHRDRCLRAPSLRLAARAPDRAAGPRRAGRAGSHAGPTRHHRAQRRDSRRGRRGRSPGRGERVRRGRGRGTARVTPVAGALVQGKCDARAREPTPTGRRRGARHLAGRPGRGRRAFARRGGRRPRKRARRHRGPAPGRAAARRSRPNFAQRRGARAGVAGGGESPSGRHRAPRVAIRARAGGWGRWGRARRARRGGVRRDASPAGARCRRAARLDGRPGRTGASSSSCRRRHRVRRHRGEPAVRAGPCADERDTRDGAAPRPRREGLPADAAARAGCRRGRHDAARARAGPPGDHARPRVRRRDGDRPLRARVTAGRRGRRVGGDGVRAVGLGRRRARRVVLDVARRRDRADGRGRHRAPDGSCDVAAARAAVHQPRRPLVGRRARR